jgi:periplasmic divalent cation tolerance protein
MLELARFQAIHAFDELVNEGGPHMLGLMNENEVMMVFCTFPDVETARQIGTTLVETQLAACVNLIPGVESIYRWQGAVESAVEVLALFKSPTTALPALERALLEQHPYDTPEFMAVKPESVTARYRDWVLQSVDSPFHHDESPAGGDEERPP